MDEAGPGAGAKGDGVGENDRGLGDEIDGTREVNVRREDEGAGTGAEEAVEAEEGEKLVPVTQAIRHRKRAQQAEQQLQEREQALSEAQAALSEKEATIQQLERRQKIDELLGQAEPVDHEAARLLTEQAVAEMAAPDVQQAVSELKRKRPYLFREREAAGGPAMAARSHSLDEPREEAAATAAMSGDRRDLLRYLRLRRSK